MYGVVNCRDVAFHKNHLKMVGLHFIRVFCFVRTFNKKNHVVHAFHKPYSFMKCPGSHPPGIRRGVVFSCDKNTVAENSQFVSLLKGSGIHQDVEGWIVCFFLVYSTIVISCYLILLMVQKSC